MPASPESVAEFLRNRAQSYKSTTLACYRTAIASTHRKAGLANPCANDIVKATLKQLSLTAAERERDGKDRKNLFDPGILESIRTTALHPGQAHTGREMAGFVRQRALVDIALCSLLYSAGLPVHAVAKLRWRDLTVRDDGQATIALNPGTPRAERAVAISAQTLLDLENIRKGARPEDRIFSIGRKTIGRRVGKLAKRAGVADPFDRNRLGRDPCQRGTGGVAVDVMRAAAPPSAGRGVGSRTEESASHRRLIDIALVSVAHAAGLSAAAAAELEWRDVEFESGDRARLNVLCGRRHRQRQVQAVVLTGQAVGDLMAIRGNAGSREKVFGLSQQTAYHRLRSAAGTAGLVNTSIDEPRRADAGT